MSISNLEVTNGRLLPHLEEKDHVFRPRNSVDVNSKNLMRPNDRVSQAHIQDDNPTDRARLSAVVKHNEMDNKNKKNPTSSLAYEEAASMNYIISNLTLRSIKSQNELVGETIQSRRRRYDKRSTRRVLNHGNKSFTPKKEHFLSNGTHKLGFQSQKIVNNVSASTSKRIPKKTRSGHKGKRFMSNLKSSLKKHLKNRHGTWAISQKEADKMFKKYYQCITDRLELLQAEEFPIKAFMAIEGEKVMMECNIW